MCGKVSGEQSEPINCIFDCSNQKFEDLVEFSEMSLISGFQEYLIKKWCAFDSSKFRGSSVELSTLIKYYRFALRHEKRRSLEKYGISYTDMNMKERCELAFIANVNEFHSNKSSDGAARYYLSTGCTKVELPR